MKRLAISLLVLFVAACGDNIALTTEDGAPATTLPSETTTPPTETTSPTTEPPAPAAISASEPSIMAGSFEFHVDDAGFGGSVGGMVPAGMGSTDQVLFVEFQLLSGEQTAFEDLAITVTDGDGLAVSAIARLSGGMLMTLADLTFTGANQGYQPNPENISWAYVVPSSTDELFLEFPTGEVVDLSPLLP